MIIREVLSPDPLLTPGLMTPALNSSVENGFVDNEESLLKGNESEPRVQIYW